MIRAINCIFLIFALIFIFQKTEKEHYYNWDAIPYSMGLHIYEGRSVDEAHYLTYYNLRDEVRPGLYQDLCCSSKYRSDQFSSSENLNSMLPMYVSKPGYISLISAVKNVFNINRVHDYYGMVEQTGSIHMECDEGYLHTSEYSDIIVRDFKNFEVLILYNACIVVEDPSQKRIEPSA